MRAPKALKDRYWPRRPPCTSQKGLLLENRFWTKVSLTVCVSMSYFESLDGLGYITLITGRKTIRNFTAVIERCPDTGLYVGFVPGFSGAHSQGETLDELNANLKEVIALLLEDGEPRLETEFVGTQNVVVA